MASRPKTPKTTAPAELPSGQDLPTIALPAEVSEKLEQIEASAKADKGAMTTEAEPILPLPEPYLTVVVTGPAAGRRRIGRAFGPEPVSINATDLTEDEIAALQADPALRVEIIDAPY